MSGRLASAPELSGVDGIMETGTPAASSPPRRYRIMAKVNVLLNDGPRAGVIVTLG